MSDTIRVGVFQENNLVGSSGSPKNLVLALEQVPDLEVRLLEFTRPWKPGLLLRTRKWIQRMLTGRVYLWEKAPARCRHMSAELDRLVAASEVDVLMMFGSEGCAYATTKVPLICWSDSIFGSRVGLYDDQKRFDADSVRHGRLVQQRALDRLDRLYMSSQWAIDRAVEMYGFRVDPAKTEVVLVGANLPDVMYEHTPDPLRFGTGSAHLLWVGVDWARKRGQLAVDVVAELRERGYDAHLHVVGPVEATSSAPWVHAYGRMNFADPAELARLRELYQTCAGLILPSDADLTPVVFAEAHAFGRPVFTNPVGGVPEMVQDGVTGRMLPHYEPKGWAQAITEYFEAHEPETIVAACRARFEEDLNWRHIAAGVARDIRGLAAGA